MYWSKIATTEQEFTEIAALNYATFVEEIPQHEENEEHRLVDKFHHENTYIIVYKNTEIVGMVAFRDVRPFSLDGKIGVMEKHLAPEVCEKLCEIRLLAVKKQHRNGRVFAKLASAIFRHFFDQGYTACVISGTVREEKLYTQMGFRQFADAVGSGEARFLPMVITRADSVVFRARLHEGNIVFYPGPVAQKTPLQPSVISHRSSHFQTDFQHMIQSLLQLTEAEQVIPLVGTGTLANEAMLGQLKSDFPDGRGLIIVNGEFGARLHRQTRQWDLQTDVMELTWGAPFPLAQIEQQLQQGNYAWLLFVHGETSTGTLNPLEQLVVLGERYEIAVCVDCVSSFGALPFSLAGVHYATVVSGKSVGALSGLAFVLCKEAPTTSSAPHYLNLAYYSEKEIPFTLPHYLVACMNDALAAYPDRYGLLTERMQQIEVSHFAETLIKTNGYPMICTLQLEDASFSETARLNGFYLHDESEYLKSRNWHQVSTIQPRFERDFASLEKLYNYFNETQKSSI